MIDMQRGLHKAGWSPDAEGTIAAKSTHPVVEIEKQEIQEGYWFLVSEGCPYQSVNFL